MVVDSALPIDIHCGKLSEWLQSRRHCGQNWREIALNIRAKIAHAIQDMPEHPLVTEMLAGTYVTYFHCLKIVEILRQTEVGSKNMFGRYSSQRMKDWQEIVQMYEKDNVYLSEAAQILQQFVQYEIPALKRQISKCQSNEQECEKKETDYEKLSRESERNYRQECQKMGLSGQNLKQELLKLSDSLPKRYESLVEKFKQLAPLVKHYETFRRQTVGVEKNVDAQVLPVLRLLQNKGNVTVFEWSRGFPPSSVERILVSENDINAEKNEEEAAIDFGFEDVNSESNCDALDFGIEEIESGDVQHVEHLQHDSSNTNVARLDDALTLLEHRDSLAKLASDLKELQAFFKMRFNELNRQQASDALIMGASSGSDLLDLDESYQQATDYCSHVSALLNDLNDSGLKQLRKLRISPVYVEKLTDLMNEPLKRSQKYTQMSRLMKEQQNEFRRQMVEDQKQLELVSRRAKELQKQIEEDISKRYQNRPVNIIGSAASALN